MSPEIGPAINTEIDACQREFASIHLAVERHARIAFRHVRCPDRRYDAVCESVALAWKWFLRLREVGKDASLFPSTLAGYAARAVRCGRRLCGQERARDAMSAVAQRRHGFVTQTLPDCESGVEGNEVIDALRDNTRTPVPEQVAFRHDFPRWLSSLSRRRQALAEDLMMGERTLEAADRHGISPGRVSQLRRQLMADWVRFCDETPCA